jgi:hypothetical protein
MPPRSRSRRSARGTSSPRPSPARTRSRRRSQRREPELPLVDGNRSSLRSRPRGDNASHRRSDDQRFEDLVDEELGRSPQPARTRTSSSCTTRPPGFARRPPSPPTERPTHGRQHQLRREQRRTTHQPTTGPERLVPRDDRRERGEADEEQQGKYLQLRLADPRRRAQGPHLFDRLNIQNPSATAQKIGQEGSRRSATRSACSSSATRRSSTTSRR